VNAKNSMDKTPLHLAAEEGDVFTIMALLRYWPDINAVSKENATALDCIARKFIEKETELNLMDCAKSDLNRAYFDNYQEMLDCRAYTVSNNFSKAAEILRHYIVKLHAAEFFVSGTNLRSVDFDDPCIQKLKADCEEELSEMKNRKIPGLNCTFFELLSRSNDDLLNSEVLNSMSDFSIYRSMILQKLKRNEKLLI